MYHYNQSQENIKNNVKQLHLVSINLITPQNFF